MISLRRAIVAIVSLAAIGVAVPIMATPASASSSQSFVADSGVSKVTGTITWTSATAFKLTNVYLYDTSCDNRSAQFYTATNLANLAQHTDSKGCGTSTHYAELDATASGVGNYFAYAQIVTAACSTTCSSTGYSDLLFNPYY